MKRTDEVVTDTPAQRGRGLISGSSGLSGESGLSGRAGWPDGTDSLTYGSKCAIGSAGGGGVY
jgi:hypothetical protein